MSIAKNIEDLRQAAIEVLQANDRDGCYADDDRDAEGAPRLTLAEALDHFVLIGKEEILYDRKKGTVDASRNTFADLHDDVDANEYALQCKLWEACGKRDADLPYSDLVIQFTNDVQRKLNVLNEWMKAGCANPWETEQFKPDEPQPSLGNLITQGCKALEWECGSNQCIDALNAFYDACKPKMHEMVWAEFEDFALKATDGEAVAWLLIRLVEDHSEHS